MNDLIKLLQDVHYSAAWQQFQDECPESAATIERIVATRTDADSNSIYKNEHYNLVLTPQWVPKTGVQTRITCPKCRGNKTYCGFGMLDEEPCNDCDQHGTIRNPDIPPAPKVPKSFYHAMASAYHKFFEQQEDNND